MAGTYRHAGVQQQGSAPAQALAGLFDDAQGQFGAQLPTAVAVGACTAVQHVRWVGDDQVERAGDAVQQVTGLDGNVADPCQGGIDRGIA